VQETTRDKNSYIRTDVLTREGPVWKVTGPGDQPKPDLCWKPEMAILLIRNNAPCIC